MTNEKSFTVSIEGNVTGEKWPGTFKVKVMFSHRDYLARDRIKRDLLGAEPGIPSPDALRTAEVFAELGIRIIDAPKWWTESNNGVDLFDANVIVEIYEKALAAEKEYLKEKAAAAEEARKALSKPTE